MIQALFGSWPDNHSSDISHDPLQACAAAFLSFVLALCFAASAQAQPRVMDIVGTGDGIDVLRTVGASFMEQEKSVRIEVSPSIGSGGGIAAVGSGKAVLGRVARELTDSRSCVRHRLQAHRPIALGFFRQSRRRCLAR